MSRAKFKKGQQNKFLNRIAEYYDFDWKRIARISNICERSLRDWRREKLNMSYRAMLKLNRISKIPLPKNIKILPENWSVNSASRLGAIRRNKLYGNPGPTEGRRKGCIVSSRRFRENPDFAKKVGFKLRTSIEIPARSSKLSELVGVLLGDGHIKTNKTQVGISLNSETDDSYALYIRNLIKELFRLNSSICYRRNEKSITVLVSSGNLVKFFIENGLKSGNKVINQVGIPKWIDSKKEYKIACLKGFMDTDGSFYSYLHRVNEKVYKNYALDFTNRLLPLLQGVRDIFRDLGCVPTLGKYKILLNKKKDIVRYMVKVGSSNPRRKEKFIHSGIS